VFVFICFCVVACVVVALKTPSLSPSLVCDVDEWIPVFSSDRSLYPLCWHRLCVFFFFFCLGLFWVGVFFLWVWWFFRCGLFGVAVGFCFFYGVFSRSLPLHYVSYFD